MRSPTRSNGTRTVAERGHGGKARRAHRRTASRGAAVGEPSIDGFGDRLLALMQDRRISRGDLYMTCGISSPSLTGYLGPARVTPGVDAVARIALEFDVDCNWLLLGVGGEGPVYRTTSRTKPTLAADLGAHVAKEVAGIVRSEPPFPDELYADWRADGDELLKCAVDMAVDSFKESRQWQRTLEEMDSVRLLAGAATRTTGAGAPARRDSESGVRADKRHVREARAQLSPEALAVLADAARGLARERPLPQLATPGRVIPTVTADGGHPEVKRITRRRGDRA